MCNFLAAGPTVTIVNTTLDFFPASLPTVDPAGFSANISKVAYFFSTTALLQGTGNFIWVPLANKYGRRPVYVASYVSPRIPPWVLFRSDFAPYSKGQDIGRDMVTSNPEFTRCVVYKPCLSATVCKT
jgi:MFS family permease